MEKPIEPGPTATPAEHRRYAEANADYSAWLAANPQPAAPAGEHVDAEKKAAP